MGEPPPPPGGTLILGGGGPLRGPPGHCGPGRPDFRRHFRGARGTPGGSPGGPGAPPGGLRGGVPGAPGGPPGPPGDPPGPPKNGRKSAENGPKNGPKKGENSPFFAPAVAKPRGGGGAPPTTLILLRNQRRRYAREATARAGAVVAGAAVRRGPPGGPRARPAPRACPPTGGSGGSRPREGIVSAMQVVSACRRCRCSLRSARSASRGALTGTRPFWLRARLAYPSSGRHQIVSPTLGETICWTSIHLRVAAGAIRPTG